MRLQQRSDNGVQANYYFGIARYSQDILIADVLHKINVASTVGSFRTFWCAFQMSGNGDSLDDNGDSM